jgi:hypothetical protein
MTDISISKKFASPHFKWSELTVSGGFPELAARAANDWTPEARENMLKLLYDVWEPLRLFIGCPIRVTSAYRPIYLNDAVGSKRTSQHVKGQAIDAQPISNEKATKYRMIHEWCENNKDKFGQAIFYWGDIRKGDYNKVGFVHISLPGKRQGQIMYKEKGGRYIPLT